MDGFKKVDGDECQRVIEKDDSNSSVTTESDEKRLNLSCRDRIHHVINTNKFQILVICLVIVDCLLVIAELLIDLQVFSVSRPNFPGSKISEILHFISIGILSLFLLELAFKVYAMRLDFFKRKMEVFDAVVIMLAFALDVAFANEEGISSGVGLIIVLRLWRVTKILNGIILSVKQQADRRLTKERRQREAMESELIKYREYCNAQEREIEFLQTLLRNHCIEFEKVQRPIGGHTINVVAEVNAPPEYESIQMTEMPRDSDDSV